MAFVTVVNPCLVLQKNDPMTTGVVYLPVTLASFAAALRKNGHRVQAVDCFGEAPNRFRSHAGFLIRGLKPNEIVARLGEPDLVVVYAGGVSNHFSIMELVRTVRAAMPSTPIAVLENTQAVTAYSLRHVQEEFYDAGATFVITGEGEERGVEMANLIASEPAHKIAGRIDGVGTRWEGKTIYRAPNRQIENLDALAFPAWDLFPLKNYWGLHYAHGPLSARKYISVLTSRGCPYPCTFCIVPELNSRKWRARGAKSVVDEMEHFIKAMGVHEFHFEDLNPTIQDARIREICAEILRRGLKVSWKLVSGTKVETIKTEETAALMAEAGCRYVSISPESGSQRIMKLIKKPFLYDHAVKIIKALSKVGVSTQACFVLGFPTENDEDRAMTRQMVRDLVKVGLDEIALFIITPIPGSELNGKIEGFSHYSELTFSPQWRQDYRSLNRFRLCLYRDFLFWKLIYHPFKILKQPFNFLFRRFQTKMEMVPYRALHTRIQLLLFHSGS